MGAHHGGQAFLDAGGQALDAGANLEKLRAGAVVQPLAAKAALDFLAEFIQRVHAHTQRRRGHVNRERFLQVVFEQPAVVQKVAQGDQFLRGQDIAQAQLVIECVQPRQRVDGRLAHRLEHLAGGAVSACARSTASPSSVGVNFPPAAGRPTFG